MIKKAIGIALSFLVLITIFSGCTGNDEVSGTTDYVELCNYLDLKISTEEYAVSDEDLNTAIKLNLSEFDIEATKLTDEIATEYFGVVDATAAKIQVKREIIENRFFEAACDYIFNNSKIIKFPPYCKEYVDKLVETQRVCAEEQDVKFEEYFLNTFGMTESEYREAALWGYADYMILRAIAEEEGYSISREERDELISYTAEFDGITYNEAVELYGYEYFDYLLYEANLKRIILVQYEEEILEVL